MSTFFTDQLKAKRKTRYLILLYALAVFAIICAIYLIIATVTSSGVPHYTTDQAGVTHIKANFSYIYNPSLFWKTFLIVSGIILLASIFRTFQLGGSGENVAIHLGGSQILPQTTNPDEKKVLNIIEEIAIASGLKVPPVYLLEDKSINAFAAGTTPGNAVIGISKGAIQKLKRDELQGVIAHEFSHILHGDMALNIRLISVLFGILFIAILGRLMLRIGLHSASGNRRRNGEGAGGAGAIAAVGLAVMIVGYVGIFFANIIKMAVSRQREFLADASAVQYTRNPAGIAGALKKIGANSSKIKHPNAEEASHMFFANGLTSAFSKLFATHPPLDVRINRIEPSFDGDYIAYAKANPVIEQTTSKQAQAKKDPLAAIKNPLESILNNPAGQILGSIGTLSMLNQTAAHDFINRLEPEIKESTHEPYSAVLLIYAILLDEDAEIRQKQLAILKADLPERYFSDFQKTEINTRKIKEKNFLSILDLTIPALNQLSKSQYIQLRNLADKLAHADQKIDLYEYTMFKVLERHFDKKFYPEKFKKNRRKSLSKLVEPASNLFLALSVLGNPDDPQEAQLAYQTATKYCAISTRYLHNFESLPEVNLNFLDEALANFIDVDYQVKEVILRAAVACISKDQKITEDEFALIRAIADSFDCPVPLLKSVNS